MSRLAESANLSSSYLYNPEFVELLVVPRLPMVAVWVVDRESD
jgi:hypothetical protein